MHTPKTQKKPVVDDTILDGIIGPSEAIQKIKAVIRKIANSRSTVCLNGESGTGKELFARALHQLSDRRDQHFVPINCAAIPETLLERELFGYMKGMGDQFTLTVSLIIAGATFAHGLRVIGSVDAAINSFNSIGLNVYVITIIFVLIILFFSFVMGSGVATMYAFAPLAPPIATGIGVAPAAMLMHLQNASSIGRLLSPISAINIAVCGLSGISPFELIRRNLVPGLAAQVISTTIIFTLYYAA